MFKSHLIFLGLVGLQILSPVRLEARLHTSSTCPGLLGKLDASDPHSSPSPFEILWVDELLIPALNFLKPSLDELKGIEENPFLIFERFKSRSGVEWVSYVEVLKLADQSLRKQFPDKIASLAPESDTSSSEWPRFFAYYQARLAPYLEQIREARSRLQTSMESGKDLRRSTHTLLFQTPLSLAPHPSQDFVAVGLAEGWIVIMDAESGRLLKKWRPHFKNDVRALLWTHDGERLVSADSEGRLKYWAFNPRTRPLELQGPCGSSKPHSKMINALAYFSRGHLLISASEDRTLRSLEDRPGKASPSLFAPGIQTSTPQEVLCLASSSDQAMIATGDDGGSISLFLRKPSQVLTQLDRFSAHPARISALAFHPKTRLLVSSSNHGEIAFFQAASNHLKTLLHLPSGRSALRLSFSPDGRFLAAGLNTGDLIILDVDSQTIRLDLGAHDNAVMALAWALDGHSLYSISLDSNFRRTPLPMDLWPEEARRQDSPQP